MINFDVGIVDSAKDISEALWKLGYRKNEEDGKETS
jgi:hypothetical protein